MKNKILLVVALLAAGLVCFGIEPNDEPNSTSNTVEARMLALEERLDALEQRMATLELRRIAPKLPADVNRNAVRGDPTPPPDANKDAVRVERLRKQIREMEDDIEVADKRIDILVTPAIVIRVGCDVRKGWGEIHYRLHPDEVPEITKALEIAKERYQLLSEQEIDYKKILQFGEKYSDLGIDVVQAKKDLIDCQGCKDAADQEKECLRAVIRANRHLFNIMPK